MKNILRRLRSRAGESLIESMAAILIFTMGSIILLSMVSTAADINTTAKQADESYNRQIVAAELADTDNQVGGKVTVTINGDTNLTDNVTVFIYRDTSSADSLYTYYTAAAAPAAGGEAG